jgi:hypothetical protein
MHHLAKSAPIRINSEPDKCLLLHPLVLQRILLLVFPLVFHRSVELKEIFSSGAKRNLLRGLRVPFSERTNNFF